MITQDDESNANNGFSSNIFGPPLWLFLHIISFNYPVNPTDDDKNNYRNFILSLVNILPCKTCRKNLTKNFKQLPLTMDDMKNRKTFSKYIYDLHNVINKMLHKPKYLDYERVKEKYEEYRAKCVTNKKTVKNKHIGCVVPLNKKHKKKCVIKIVKTKKNK